MENWRSDGPARGWGEGRKDRGVRTRQIFEWVVYLPDDEGQGLPLSVYAARTGGCSKEKVRCWVVGIASGGRSGLAVDEIVAKRWTGGRESRSDVRECQHAIWPLCHWVCQVSEEGRLGGIPVGEAYGPLSNVSGGVSVFSLPTGTSNGLVEWELEPKSILESG